MSRSLQLLGFVVALVCCAARLASVGASPGQQRDPYVFRTEAALVRLDVSVVDPNGNAIADLLPSDFDVRQDGKQQRVVFAEFHREPQTGDVQQGADTPVRTEPNGHRIIVIVDDFRMSFESVVRAREELLAMLRQRSGSRDQMMIVGTRSRTTTVAFTNDPVVLAKQVEALRWEAPTLRNQPTEDERRRSCKEAVSNGPLDVDFSDGPLAFVASAVSELRSMPGRKIILLLADGINDACPEYRWRFEERLRRLTDLAARSSSIIYALQTRAFSSGVRMPDQRGTTSDVTGPLSHTIVHNEISERMRKLAEPTGGYADRSNSISGLVTAAFKDSTSYYVLAYEPPAGTFTTKEVRYRRVQVRVSTRGAVVRTRAGFYSITDSDLIPK